MNGLSIFGFGGCVWIAVSLVRANGVLNRGLALVERADRQRQAQR